MSVGLAANIHGEITAPATVTGFANIAIDDIISQFQLISGLHLGTEV
jgi:hypothetical protein